MFSLSNPEDWLDPMPRKTDVVGYNQLRRIPA
jgi:hypothetical protein